MLERRARIVSLCDDEEARQLLTEAFSKAGYALIPPEGAANADLGLVDLRRAVISGKKALSIANLLRRESPECRLVFVADPTVNATSREALRRHGEVICAERDLDHVIERCRQIIRLRNIAEEAGERLKSLAALNRLAAFPTIAASASPPSVLIAGNPGPAALRALNALRKGAARCVSVFSAGQVMRAMDNSDFDCLIFLPEAEHDPLLSLMRALRRHPKHGATPVITIAADAQLAAAFACKGASETVLAAHISADLETRTQLAARRSRLLRSMRLFLTACVGDTICDPVSTAFTGTFAMEHGARLCARADQTGRPLSALALTIAADGATEGEPGKRALRRAARLINRVTRAEDVAARIAPSSFLILMPATTRHDAEKAALRLEGVLENTVFRGERDNDLYGISASSGVCERPQGVCVEETVALALKQINKSEAHSVTPPQRQFPQ